MDSLVVILKVTERCNINCSYCYFFNGIDQSFKAHSAKMGFDTICNITEYFRLACVKHDIKRLRFDFHGGEPLLLRHDYLAKICHHFAKHLGNVTTLEFALQTNGMLIDDEWVALFDEHQINVGISIDGPPEIHDKQRIDHRGRGTYSRVRQGLEVLRQARQKKGLTFGVGVISVINPEFSGKQIYRHFVDELKVNSFDFLLPDTTWDSVNEACFDPEAYGHFLCDVFDEWIEDKNPRIYIRILDAISSNLLKKDKKFHDFSGWIDDFLLITIDSDGGISPDDTYRSADPTLMRTGLTVSNSSFSDFLEHDTVSFLIRSAKNISPTCSDCEWRSNCRSGSLLHRYSRSDKFNKHSVYCEGLKVIYKKMHQEILSFHQDCQQKELLDAVLS